MLPLTDEEKQALRTGILREQEAAGSTGDARLAQAKIGNILPGSVTMSDLPGALTERMP